MASWLTCFNHLMCGVSCDLKKYDSFYQLCCISELLANDVFLVSIKFIYSEKATKYMNFNNYSIVLNTSLGLNKRVGGNSFGIC